MNRPDVSIVIVSWNTLDVLRGCLKSIQEETRSLSYEVFVVDNASSDGTPEMVREEFPLVRLIANEDNRGFAAANNQGLSLAQGRYALLLNPDTIVLDRAIEKTVAYSDKHPEYAVVGCQVMENESRIQQTCCRFHSVPNMLIWLFGLNYLFPQSKLFGRERMGWWKRDCEMEVDVVSGMFMLVRREAMEQVGLLDEDYFIYAEEVDWCCRFKKAGWKCVFAPVARIIHLDGGSKSTEQVSEKMYVQQQKSILIFLWKNQGRLSWLTARLIYAITMSQRAALWSLMGLFKSGPGLQQRKRQAHAALKFHLLGVDICRE